MGDGGVTDDVLTVHVVHAEAAAADRLAKLLGSYGYVVISYGSGVEFLERLGGCPDADLAQSCTLLDLRLPGLDGVGVLRAMPARRLRLPTIAMCAKDDTGLAARATQAGAADLIDAPAEEGALIAAVAAVLARVLHHDPRDRSGEAARARIARLTMREREVLLGLVRGHPNKVIAHQLGISPRTVEIHRSRLMLKLECRGIASAVRLGLLGGLA